MLALRSAKPGDGALLLRFIQALADYEREPDAVKVDAATLDRQLAAPAPPFECLLAELDGVTVGFALYFHTYSTWRGKRGIWLEDLFVLPEHRGAGVGKTLLERVAAIALERGCARLEWSVLDWNTPAIEFYERQGATLLREWKICRVTDDALASLGRGGHDSRA